MVYSPVTNRQQDTGVVLPHFSIYIVILAEKWSLISLKFVAIHMIYIVFPIFRSHQYYAADFNDQSIGFKSESNKNHCSGL